MLNSQIEFVNRIVPHGEEMVTVIVDSDVNGEIRRNATRKKMVYVEKKRALALGGHVAFSSGIVYAAHDDPHPLQRKERRVVYRR